MEKIRLKKGISLIILVISIIVILILAGSVILSLSQNNPIKSATEASFKTSLDQYNSDLTIYLSKKYAENSAFDPKSIYATIWDGTENVSGTIKEYIPSITAADGAKYSIQAGKIYYNAGNNEEEKWATETAASLKIENKPVLVTGMKAIIWNTTTLTWDEVTSPDSNTNWYDYANGRWANAQTTDGSMWVWIPRYIYKISAGWHTNNTGVIEIQFSKGINDNWNSSLIGTINTGTGSSASNGTWTNHPSFTFGSTELTGIWVAKFEATNNGGKIKSAPNISAWGNININDMFNACRAMEVDNTYGWGTTGVGFDTHLMKNVEWGAAEYLAISKYGVNGNKIWMNPDSIYKTGRAGTGPNVNSSSTTYTYNNLTYGVKASTTSNIYGIYDMCGGIHEYTAAYVNNAAGQLTTYGSSLVNAANSYKDVYTVTTDSATNNYDGAISKKGDGIYEVSNSYAGSNTWFRAPSEMPVSTTPFFIRGGYSGDSINLDIFRFTRYFGEPIPHIGFRPVLVVSESL